MSHVTLIEKQFISLACLEKAANSLGMELVKNQLTYKWFGRHVGDYPLPKGFTKEDMGKCDHVLRLKNNPGAYEVGLCKSRDDNGYVLLYDFWAGGYGLEDAIGKDAWKLCQQYSVQAALEEAYASGFDVTKTILENGDILIQGVK